MYPVSVRIDEEHVESLTLALAALQAERAVCQRWGAVSTRHVLAEDDLQEILERARNAWQLSEKNASALVALIGRRKPW